MEADKNAEAKAKAAKEQNAQFTGGIDKSQDAKIDPLTNRMKQDGPAEKPETNPDMKANDKKVEVYEDPMRGRAMFAIPPEETAQSKEAAKANEDLKKKADSESSHQVKMGGNDDKK